MSWSQLYEAVLNRLGRRAVNGKGGNNQSLYLNVFMMDSTIAGREASPSACLLVPGRYHQNLAQIIDSPYSSQ